ncbi:MAG: J domain-containing protein [Phycisphaeraceae bacterium]|nr:J domain-containing protein [Phycisphaeraceae bacterium]
MGVKFQDYYATLGVTRTATAEEIQRAYRKLAREFHPDVNTSPGAPEKFKQAAEAYEVLKDPERRARYDQLGADYKPGQEFRPPPGWRSTRNGATHGRHVHVKFGGAGAEEFENAGFSDFFEAIFGGMDAGESFSSVHGASSGRRTARPRPGADQEAIVSISLREAFAGATRSVSLAGKDKSFEVKIPSGVGDGQVIRLAGQGAPGTMNAPAGDLLLRIRVEADPRFRVEGLDLHTVLPITPWEAALGTRVDVETLAGPVTLTVPPGAGSGQKLRLRGKGMPDRSGAHGDLLVELRIVVPKVLSDAERAAFEQLARVSSFNPRSGA